jgi:formate hydrogenlyase subunit 3/multisubunit Na+/H+ antiporter MnhD subunit
MILPLAVDPARAAVLALIGACALLAASGVPGLFLGWRSTWGPRIATALVLAGSLLGLAGGVLALLRGGRAPAVLFEGPVALSADALSGLFALPVFLVGGLGSVYGAAYWSPRHHPRNGRRLRLCYGLLLASLAFITLSRGAIPFLVAWEAMALTNFFLVTTEEEEPAVRRAGWLYLLYSHVTILGLFVLFVLEERVHGELALGEIAAGAPPMLRVAIFAVALVAFGVKAGAMPLHSWLPDAHASAPSHVSALMSGVVIKMGVYGLVRVSGLFDAPPLAWGVVVLVIGSLSAFFGVLFALAQHDIKRLLAYHSIENIGIMLLGLGLAMVGRSTGRLEWVALGLAGCLLHVWNHALFKSLLFLGAGAVVHATGTRDLERTGGLAHRMPATAALFLLGAVAICGLPPLNGFVSELLVYLGLARAAVAPDAAWAALPAPALAATGALAVACFAKVFGVVFLGTPRTKAAAAAREAPRLMVGPMVVLAAACAALGLAPGAVAPALDGAVAVWIGRELPDASLASLAPFGWVSGAGVALVLATAALGAAILPVCRRARRRQPDLPTWDCGYAASSPRLQYTASSFAEIVTSRFGWALRPEVDEARVEGLFPARTSFHSRVEDAVLDRLLAPLSRRALRVSALLRAAPQGQLQRYILYIVAVLVPVLAWAFLGGGAAR